MGLSRTVSNAIADNLHLRFGILNELVTLYHDTIYLDI